MTDCHFVELQTVIHRLLSDIDVLSSGARGVANIVLGVLEPPIRERIFYVNTK